MDGIRGDYNQYLKTYQKNISQIERTQKADNPSKGSKSQESQGNQGTKQKDSLELTGLSREIKAAREEISRLDSDKQARIQDLKESVQTGTYHVSGDELAEKIMQESGAAKFDRGV